MTPGQYTDTYAPGGARPAIPRPAGTHHEVLHGSVAGGGHPPRRRHPRPSDRARAGAGQARCHGVVAGDGRVDLRLRQGHLRQQRRLLPQPGQRRHGDDARPRGRTGPLPRPMRGRRRGHRCGCSHGRHLRRSLPTGEPSSAASRPPMPRASARPSTPLSRPPPADVRCDGDTTHRRLRLQRRARADEWPDLHGHDRHRRGPLRQGPARLGSAPRLRDRGGGARHADPAAHRRRCPRQRLQPRPPESAHHQPLPDCLLVRRQPGGLLTGSTAVPVRYTNRTSTSQSETSQIDGAHYLRLSASFRARVARPHARRTASRSWSKAPPRAARPTKRVRVTPRRPTTPATTPGATSSTPGDGSSIVAGEASEQGGSPAGLVIGLVAFVALL